MRGVHEVGDGILQLATAPFVNVVAVRGADGWTLVDAGLAPTARRLVRMLSRVGIGVGDVERIVLTHGHLDHAGGAEHVRVVLQAREVLVADGDVADVRSGTNAGDAPVSRGPLPTPGYPPVTGPGRLADPLPLADGRHLVPVPTPGHTPGHTSLHLPDAGVAIGGDAVFNVFRLTPSPGFLCSDAVLNRRSVATLAGLAPSTLLLAHGTPVEGDVAGRLRAIVA